MRANGLRCATMRPMRPDPAPISSTFSAPEVFAQAPSNIPSVPTFIGVCSWKIVNCLNLKGLVFFVVITIKQKSGSEVADPDFKLNFLKN